MKGVIALFMLLGVITMVCWLVAPPIFSTFEILKESTIYRSGLMMSILLPVLLFGFLGLALYLKSRD